MEVEEVYEGEEVDVEVEEVQRVQLDVSLTG